MGSNLAVEHTGESFVDGKGLDAGLQRWGMVLMLGFFTVCVGTQTSTAIRQLDMVVIGLGPYLQELGIYAGLTSLSLLPVLILLRTLDN